MAETAGVGHRGGYYDQAGALRDMIQNHLLQVLCPVSYTHLRAHETVLDIVCRLLLEKKKEHDVKD